MCLGIPGQIVEIVDDTNQIAKVDVSGVRDFRRKSEPSIMHSA
jgi:hydrogenase maturation factor